MGGTTDRETGELTAQRMEAAAWLSIPSGTGVTQFTQETWREEFKLFEVWEKKVTGPYQVLAEGAVSGVATEFDVGAV